jgi:serine protease Do
MTRTNRLLVATTFIAAGVVVGTGLAERRPAIVPDAAAAPLQVAADSAPGQLSHAFRRATDNAMPGVVFIDVESRAGGIREGSGSGFIFRPDGDIHTNNHVVDGATHVTVMTQDRREFSASVVGRDPNTDIAVIKIDARGLPVVALANSDAIGVGDWVVALGYPLQLGATATAGIVSAKGRNIGILEGQQSLEHYIQTDAAINPGNSGGPLVDLLGRVGGVNSAIKSPTGYYSGYGFAVPINIAARVADDLIEHGAVRRPKLGVMLTDVTAADVAVYSLPRAAGAEIVQSPEPGSPADRAGFRLGDVIVALNGEPVELSGDLTERLALFQPGDNVAFDIIRYGEHRTLHAHLGEFETPDASLVGMSAPDPYEDANKLGFEALPLTPRIARQIGTTVTDGLVVSDVLPASAAAHASLRRTDVIISINGRKVDSPAALRSIERTLKPGQPVSLILALPDGSDRIINYQVRT